MQPKQFEKQDYLTLLKWWKEYDWDPIPEDLLPKTGFITDVAASFIYLSDEENIGVLSWIIANPGASITDKKQHLNAVVKKCLEAAQKRGKMYVYTVINHPSLERLLNRMGFEVMGTQMTSMLYTASEDAVTDCFIEWEQYNGSV